MNLSVLPLRRFWHREDGGALVEFGLILPSLVLVLGMAVEGGRTFLGFQTTVSGVRDATRYLSRVVQADACVAGTVLTTQWDGKLTQIVRQSQSGEALLPSGITVQHVTSSVVCQNGGYRQGPAPVATVTATLRITYPFGGLLSLAGVDTSPLTTRISDETRIVGS